MVPLKPDSIIKKKSGSFEPYSREKLLRSLKFSGASDGLAKRVLDKVEAKFTDDMSTAQIHKLAFDILKRDSTHIAANYSIKRSLLELGPAGFHFEKFVAQILQAEGFETEVGIVLPGHCINHEVDVIARSKGKTYFVECKFHKSAGKKNDVKTALYINARNLDLKESKKIPEFDQFWLVSNTVFTKDAIQYGDCVGLGLVGINHPKERTLGDLIRKHALYPLTALRTLKKNEKAELLDSGLVTCQDLWKSPETLVKMLRSKASASKVLSEIRILIER